MPDFNDIPGQVERLLASAIERRASDVHVEPGESDATVRFRLDGLLSDVAHVSPDDGRAIVNRLMVMAQLLTYRLDVPQEGRATIKANDGRSVDLRIAIMPTAHGLRAAVRLPAELSGLQSIEDLSLDEGTLSLIDAFLRADSGALLVVGPAGSGKTTTAYAILEALRDRSSGLSIVTLEDPVERRLRGITQIPVTPFGQLTYATALRSMLRQDPQVLMLGEIRDAETAGIAMQAALSGHRLVCTFHASDPAGAIVRLLEMGIEPYQVASSAFGVVSMRLLRRKTSAAGYAGRAPVCESVRVTDSLRKVIVNRGDSASLRSAYRGSPGYRSLLQHASSLVKRGITDAAEAQRVLGTGAEGEGAST